MLPRLILLLICLLLSASLACATTFSGKVVKITDGDTIQVMLNGKAEKIRLAGIDTPEKAALRPGRHALQPQPVCPEDRYGQGGNHRPLRSLGRGSVPAGRKESEPGTGPGRICLVVPQIQQGSDDW